MKTNFFKLSVSLFFAIAVLATSCKKDSPAPVDSRDKLVGTYFGNVSTEFKFSSVNRGSDYSQTDTATISVTKDPANAIGLIITQVYNGTKVKTTNLGVNTFGNTFTVPDQKFLIATDTMTISGVNVYSYGNSYYQGAYEEMNAKLYVGYEGTYPMNTGQEVIAVPYSTTVIVTKK